MNQLLSKSSILAAQDLPFENVDVPEWGGTVRVIGLNAKDAQRYSSRLVVINPLDGKVQKLKLDTVMTDLLVRTIVDENNDPLFSEDDIEALGKKSAQVLTRLFEVAQRLSGLGDSSAKEIKANLA
ncbi:MAG: hypothetical protein HY863_15785 [Chloroflexi bacterium]|nr:hypothetical protein [Chloroflexota bacterium]